jgi:hypothetical protein
MNLGRFRFEVDPTQTPARLHLEHRIHISRWLRVAQGRRRRGGGGRRRADGDNGAARWPGRRGAGQGIPILGDMSGKENGRRRAGPTIENRPKGSAGL